MGTASRLISFSEGGGEPSTHPFQPFLAAVRFLRTLGTGAEALLLGFVLMSSSSCGVFSLPSDPCDVADETEGPGVQSGVG